MFEFDGKSNLLIAFSKAYKESTQTKQRNVLMIFKITFLCEKVMHKLSLMGTWNMIIKNTCDMLIHDTSLIKIVSFEIVKPMERIENLTRKRHHYD